MPDPSVCRGSASGHTGVAARRWFAAVAIVACALASSAPAAARVSDSGGPPSVSVRVNGAPETVFKWASGPCQERMIPDAPARAFRNADGKVRLVAASFDNWSMHGPSLDEVRPDCRPLFRGAERSEPHLFDDRGWIEAFYTLDGRTVYALISNEWDGFRHAASGVPLGPTCRVRQYAPGCMVYSINLAVSSNGGRIFRYPASDGGQVVAGAAYHPAKTGREGNATAGELPAPGGVPTVSNIVERGGYFYAMVFYRGAGPHEDGNCLMRTDDLGDASRWRAWDGQDFTIRPVSHGPNEAPSQRCALVARRTLGWDVRSLSWHAKTQSYIAIMHSASRDAGGRRIVGVHYATSPDLLRWSDARLLMEVPNTLDSTCRPPAKYPSMLDAGSSSPNFETVGDNAYIYYTQYNLENCRISLDRDLRRLPVMIGVAP